jgi:hypothetical protein
LVTDRAILTLVMGAALLGGCAAKQKAVSAQAVSAQEDKVRAVCIEQALNKQTYADNVNSFAFCMRAKGYNEYKLYPSETMANAGKPLAADASTRTPESSPGVAAGDDYERAVASYNNCILDHTANLSACEQQWAIMNAEGKVSSRRP